MASANKPPTAYFLYLNANREKLVKECGTSDPKVVSAKAGETWKNLPAKAKKPFEDEAKQKKEAYEKFIATAEGQKALEEKKSARAEAKAEKEQKVEAKAQKLAEKEERKNRLECKAAVKAVEKDDALKKPQTAYWLWLGDNRERIVTMVGSKGADVSKKGGEMWKALSNTSRAPYEQKSKEQKDAYEKYIASAEGAAALKAFKDATQAAKDQFRRTEPATEAATKEGTRKQKAVDDAVATGKSVKVARLGA